MEKVSIIIPLTSFNNYVYECIKECLKLDYPWFEIILLPDNNIDIPSELHSNKIKIIKTGDIFISKKRNIGIKNSNANYYAFIDSDAYPCKDWLNQAIKSFLISPDIGAVGGPNITPPSDNLLEKVVGNSLKSFLVSGGRAFRKKISKNRFCNDLPSCNLIVKKETINHVGYFNENLIVGEDIEFCNRIIEKNKRIFYNNKVIVFHHNRSLFMPFILQRIVYGASIFKIFKEKPSINNVFLFIPLLFILFLTITFILGFFFKIFHIISLGVLSLYLFIILIESIRYSNLIELPLTVLAMLIGNLIPGVGSALVLMKIRLNVVRIYKNNNYKK